MKKFLLFLFLLATLQGFSQQDPEPLNEEERREVVDSVIRLLNDNYVFPEVAQQMSALIRKNQKAGDYRDIEDPREFSTRLTEDLRSISKDKHLNVKFAPEQIAEIRQNEASGHSDEIPESWIASERRKNFGFQEVKILEGNIGYLDLRGFSDTDYAGETAVAAMNFLTNSDALIFDLRQNGGGYSEMIQLLTSYLFDAEPVHLNNFYYRPTDQYSQTWTLPHIPGKRRPDIDVYVLTSNYTFSAAEEFSYNLRNLERATLVGETTGGGAHPGGSQIATDRYMVWVPTGRAINPISNTNWEGTGVKPHIEVSAIDALNVAHEKALKELMAKTSDEAQKRDYEWYLPILRARANPVQVDQELLKSYAGKYGERTIFYEEGQLYYQREGYPKYQLVALAEDLFMYEQGPGFRLQILREKDRIIGLQGMHSNGYTDRSMRDQDQIKP